MLPIDTIDIIIQKDSFDIREIARFSSNPGEEFMKEVVHVGKSLTMKEITQCKDRPMSCAKESHDSGFIQV